MKSRGPATRCSPRTCACWSANGLIERNVHPTVPPRVENTLTVSGQALRETVHRMCDWTHEYFGHMRPPAAASTPDGGDCVWPVRPHGTRRPAHPPGQTPISRPEPDPQSGIRDVVVRQGVGGSHPAWRPVREGRRDDEGHRRRGVQGHQGEAGGLSRRVRPGAGTGRSPHRTVVMPGPRNSGFVVQAAWEDPGGRAGTDPGDHGVAALCDHLSDLRMGCGHAQVRAGWWGSVSAACFAAIEGAFLAGGVAVGHQEKGRGGGFLGGAEAAGGSGRSGAAIARPLRRAARARSPRSVV